MLLGRSWASEPPGIHSFQTLSTHNIQVSQEARACTLHALDNWRGAPQQNNMLPSLRHYHECHKRTDISPDAHTCTLHALDNGPGTPRQHNMFLSLRHYHEFHKRTDINPDAHACTLHALDNGRGTPQQHNMFPSLGHQRECYKRTDGPSSQGCGRAVLQNGQQLLGLSGCWCVKRGGHGRAALQISQQLLISYKLKGMFVYSYKGTGGNVAAL
eukprot:1162153-Pelagomonas_calceolata.AAC.7